MLKTPLLSLTAALALLAAPTPARCAETDFGQVATYVAHMLEQHHYSHHECDDEVSRKLLDSFLNFLDVSHVYFTQQDVDNFRSKYATSLDDHIAAKNISPALEIYDIYEQRVKERVAFAKNVVATKKFTFDSTHSLELRRDKLPWPKDKAAADKLWNDLIEGDLLSEHLSDQAKLDEAQRKKDKKLKDQAEGKPEVKKDDAKANKDPAAHRAEIAEDPPDKRVLKRYEQLLEQLGENDREDISGYFLSCLAQVYDPHTEYMTEPEWDNFNVQMKHSLVGIGALLSQKDNVAEIQGIVVGGPADKQGDLKLKDKILAVAQGEGKSLGDFIDIKYMKLQKVVEMIRGKAGTKVSLRVHPGEADDPSLIKEITIVRGEVELKEKLANAELILTPPIDGKVSRYGWINLSSFYADMEEGTVSTTVDVSRLLKRLMAEKIEGLVFDLRGNGGGSLEEAIKLTGLFIPKGPVVQAKDSRDQITWRDCENERPVYDGPLIVLTDRASASASEIFAAALQDYRRAVIVGEKSTFGKGTVQTILPVERYMPFFSEKSRAGALKVTIQKFYRIAGGSTQLRGVIPDVSLPSVRDVMDIGEDSLPYALPYDTIPSRTYTYFTKNPLPSDELRSRAKNRISSNPEFQYVSDDTKHLKERIDRNTVSLNEKLRQQELEENRVRFEKRKDERRAHNKEIAEKSKDTFQTFRLTLDNVDKNELVTESSFTREQSTGMRLAAGATSGDDEDGENSQYPYGFDPVKLETFNILHDWIDLSSHRPTTAATDSKKGAGS